MFQFLNRLQAPTILADCEKEMQRTAAMNVYFRTPQDATKRAELLQKAASAGLGDHDTIKRLDFLQRLFTALDNDPTPAMQDALLAEATQYQLENTSGPRALREHRELELLKEELELLKEHGPRIVAHDERGRPVYFQREAEFKNKPGLLEVRADGITFTGEVAIEIPWSNVVHVAKTTHTHQGVDHSAVALQEGKRRTPTKLVFVRDHDGACACEVTMSLWEQSKKQR